MSVPLLTSEDERFAADYDYDSSNSNDGRIDPSKPVIFTNFEETQEMHEVEACQKELLDWALLAARSFTLLLFLLSYVLVFVNVCRGSRLKNWRLYCVVSLSVLLWLCMGLYIDHVDECTHFIHVLPQRVSIYWCFRNLLHGLSLYLCLLLLSHLSDFQHRGVWLWLVGAVVFLPLLVTVAILVIDLRIHPEQRYSTPWTLGIGGARLFCYNVINAILLFVFSPRFCTGRLYGTYSERRSTLTVTVARWTFAFLLLHNLVACASYAAIVCSKTLDQGWQQASMAHRILEEVELLLIVLCVPVSYLVGAVGQKCCGVRSEAELEMEKMDKIYQEVWTTNQEMKRHRHNGGPIINTNPEGNNANINSTAQQQRQNGSNLSMNSNASSNPAGAAVANRNPNGSILNGSRASSIVTLQASPGSGRRDNASALKTPEKRRHRESYFEAVSMGSLAEEEQQHHSARATNRGRAPAGGDRDSVTSEPVDL